MLINGENSQQKNWVCLFTCANIRAVHLELVNNMNTNSFLMCLRRFIARRGNPLMIISDNATQFKLGKTVMDIAWQSVVREDDVQSYVANEGIEWKFITEYAPWQGGLYERLIGLTKRSLRKTMGKRRMNEQQLLTILVEIEAVLNSRPLMYVENDINNQTLTPAHFISINHSIGSPIIDINYNPFENSANELLEIWKRGQSRLDEFWHVWRHGYLHTLRERHTLMMKSKKGEKK